MRDIVVLSYLFWYLREGKTWTDLIWDMRFPALFLITPILIMAKPIKKSYKVCYLLNSGNWLFVMLCKWSLCRCACDVVEELSCFRCQVWRVTAGEMFWREKKKWHWGLACMLVILDALDIKSQVVPQTGGARGSRTLPLRVFNSTSVYLKRNKGKSLVRDEFFVLNL